MRQSGAGAPEAADGAAIPGAAFVPQWADPRGVLGSEETPMHEGLRSGVVPAPKVTAAGLSRAEAIIAEQVPQIYRLSRATYAGCLLAAAVVVAALWNVVPRNGLLAWAGAVVVVVSAR